MSDSADVQSDEQLLIDFILDRCDEQTAGQVRRQLAEDADFAALHGEISETFRVLSAYEVPEPAPNLVERTMARVRALRSSEALLEVKPIRRGAFPSTFSLRELGALAAAAVLVIGILLPAVRHTARRADRALCSANVGQIGTALSHYANEADEVLPAAPSGRPWLPVPGQLHVSNSKALFLLVRRRLAHPDVFHCPAAGGETFVVQAGMTDFPSSETIGYSYQHSLGGAIRLTDPRLADVADQMAILVDSTPVFAKGVFHPDRVGRTVSDNHPEGGQNVLYLDMHVQWVTDCRVGVNGNNIFLAEGVYNYTGQEKPVSPVDTFVLPNAVR